MDPIKRRDFLKTTALSGAGILTSNLWPARILGKELQAAQTKPIAIASANGPRALEKAMEMIKQGSDALDAVIAGVNIVEDDPNDMSVGYGGLPNEEGVVELDSAVMHGPSYRAAGVAALQNIKNPSKVAQHGHVAL